jgi:hypothetical protein
MDLSGFPTRRAVGAVAGERAERAEAGAFVTQNAEVEHIVEWGVSPFSAFTCGAGEEFCDANSW